MTAKACPSSGVRRIPVPVCAHSSFVQFQSPMEKLRYQRRPEVETVVRPWAEAPLAPWSGARVRGPDMLTTFRCASEVLPTSQARRTRQPALMLSLPMKHAIET